jgi:hypothetical protein
VIAHPIDTSFVRIDGAWPAAIAVRLLEAVAATTANAIVTDGEPPRYHAVGTALLRRSLRGRRSLVRDALDLDRRVPTPVVFADDLAAAGSQLVVVFDGGVLYGLFDGQAYLDVLQPLDPSEAVGGELSIHGPAEVAADAEARFLVDLQLRGAGIVDPADVSFLVEARGTAGDIAITIDPASHDFGVHASVVVKPHGTGEGAVKVRALVRGQPVAKATMRFEISRAGAAQRSVSAPVPAGRPPEPGLTMVLDEASDGSYRVLVYGEHGELGHRRFGPISPSRALLGDLALQIGELERTAGTRGADARIEAWGEKLSEALMPEDLRALLWQLRDRLSSCYIVSSDHALPWELCRLTGTDGSGAHRSGGFLCEITALTRWVMDMPPKTTLAVDRIALIVPNDSRLPEAAAERRDLFDAAPGVSVIPASFVELREALARGEYDAWHFAGHGLYDVGRGSRPSLILDDDSRLEPEDICGVVRNIGRRSPIVLLNACHTAPLPVATTIDAWSHHFVAAGAGAFIGTRWQIRDLAARRFAQVFYTAMRHGEPLGAAVRAARLAIRDNGLTWLAYTVFGHPLARVAARG